MKRAILGAFILALVPSLAQAQTSGYSEGQGYAYLGAGGLAEGDPVRLHAGGGGEFFFTRHIGMGGEIGHTELANILSANFVASFRARDNKKKFDPFVTAGYSHFADDHPGPSTGVNFGGGVNWWFKERLGLRFEFRDSVLQAFYKWGGPFHTMGIRIGLTFR